MKPEYCKNFTRYQRRVTQVVMIGGIPLGGEYPIRVQSMTNTLTSDVPATANQIDRIQKAGADYARVTVPGQKDVESLRSILGELQKRGCRIPIIADIHFNPKLANLSAAVVSKVRINPGNFVDKKLFKSYTYSDADYQQELLGLRQQFNELLVICRENQTALRIGTNHGSLSDRIMSRYGDSPEGMAESAMEFLRICHEENFKDVVVSMKASNTRIMVYATRLVLKKMEEEGMHYPLHLGVTEAGEGEDGRIRSAVGIGTLLADGIGETLRVSLTEDPEIEVPVAQKMIDYVSSWQGHTDISGFGSLPIDPYAYKKRSTRKAGKIGGDQLPGVIAGLDSLKSVHDLAAIGWKQGVSGKWEFEDLSPDMLFLREYDENIALPPEKYIVMPAKQGHNLPKNEGIIPLFTWDEFKGLPNPPNQLAGIEILARELTDETIAKLNRGGEVFLVLSSDNINGFADLRAAIFRLMNQGCDIPVILKRNYPERNKESFQLKASIDLGGLFLDGLGDGIWLTSSSVIPTRDCIETAFGILQASRVRVSKTEYISCPSCGRTLFDLQSTTRKIRERTAHLKGLKIGIMGCIVNGPGEMADANYGYVGTGKGKVTLYKEKDVVKRNIPEEDAVDELIGLIKENGDWVDP